MNNPRVFLAALIILVLILSFLISTLPSKLESHVQGRVINQTLTQSLDGHRRYLNIQLPDGSTALIQAPASSHCPIGSIVKLIKQHTSSGDDVNYHFEMCFPAEPK
ncbi:hypothetical protein TW81_05695 [Vibrio galatheae]|uniref:Uncharacterized protein n=1 Tax=Vibrio galatheae TaxID=579748 RepID=A0A0F4NKV8_9VIBR|nr:hypothetical protein [Vibrio galatheae]KJY83820.1 hypothetical protein TW81_05695 [Vibrio galatheae]